MAQPTPPITPASATRRPRLTWAAVKERSAASRLRSDAVKERRTAAMFRMAVADVVREVLSLDPNDLRKPVPPPYSTAHHLATQVTPEVLIVTLDEALAGQTDALSKAILL